MTLYAGANDIVRPKVDLDALAAAYDDAIGRLREKLGDDAAAPRMIFTEPGIGYRFAASP